MLIQRYQVVAPRHHGTCAPLRLKIGLRYTDTLAVRLVSWVTILHLHQTKAKSARNRHSLRKGSSYLRNKIDRHEYHDQVQGKSYAFVGEEEVILLNAFGVDLKVPEAFHRAATKQSDENLLGFN
jgi:hypothetical protein